MKQQYEEYESEAKKKNEADIIISDPKYSNLSVTQKKLLEYKFKIK